MEAAGGDDVDLEAQFAALMEEDDADADGADTLSSAAHSVSSPISDASPVPPPKHEAASDTDENTTAGHSSRPIDPPGHLYHTCTCTCTCTCT